ncbi:MAG: UDP-2,4-diacetamido-2,4,6-trideoxy-beta-L-altropyranose hydrolase [Methanothrix sp.]
MVPTLLIRADASPEMGTGHVMRCLALAQAWKDAGGCAIFAMAGEMPEIECRLRGDGFTVHHIIAKPGSEKDAALTADLAISQNACFVVVDGYQFGSEYQMSLKKARLHLLFIDDYGHAEFYYADLVLNQNIYAQEELYNDRDFKTELLLGTPFVLLRREFLSWRNRIRKNPDKAGKILVTLGGSDPDNVTLKILSSLQSLTANGIEVVVVVGVGNAHNAALQAVAKLAQVPIRLVRNASNMPELMTWADMAIISGGTTSYETAFLGLPSLIVIIAANQVRVAEKLAEIQAATNLGWHHNLSCAYIQKTVEDLQVNCKARESMSRIGKQLVDGRGTTRVIKAILGRVIKVRKAVESDCEQIYKWANDEDTRAASFNSDLIAWDTHRNWFLERLQDSNCLMLICGNDRGNSLGLVRFDLAGDEAIISINLNPYMRGQGLAGFIIIRTLDELFKRYSIYRVSAFIKPQNLRSAKAFERVGFSIIGPCIIKGNEAWHYMMTNEDLISQSPSQ